ncbi:single-strand binding protein [Frankia torreyi]|uniref:Single-strand binding protein n=1 Tax=Frankia torreyi TaxID=1856 RepID=A0A0D8BMN4_9ACTN|nr:single-strand binding protein [Frankia torreyi]KQM04765.1 single-strand binding protein [Frankia sp. CpI1-P]
MLDTTITLVGNLVEDPEHRTTTNGASVCSFRLASTPRRFDRSENRWVDGATSHRLYHSSGSSPYDVP